MFEGWKERIERLDLNNPDRPAFPRTTCDIPMPKHKPPLGIVPKKYHDRGRLESLYYAITRYLGEKKPIPIEWVEEYNELAKALKEMT